MATTTSGKEANSLSASIFHKSKKNDPTSTLDGNVQHVACVIQPALGMDSASPTAVARVGNLLSAVFAGNVTKVSGDPYYEVKLNEDGFCLRCTTAASWEVKFGTDVVVVEVMESVHYAMP